MSLQQSLVLGHDVEERTAWGIDLATAMNLLSLLPRDVPDAVKQSFLETKLLRAI